MCDVMSTGYRSWLPCLCALAPSKRTARLSWRPQLSLWPYRCALCSSCGTARELPVRPKTGCLSISRWGYRCSCLPMRRGRRAKRCAALRALRAPKLPQSLRQAVLSRISGQWSVACHTFSGLSGRRPCCTLFESSPSSTAPLRVASPSSRSAGPTTLFPAYLMRERVVDTLAFPNLN